MYARNFEIHSDRGDLPGDVDEDDESDPLFQKFGGRTRRKSSLLSTIARPCSSISSIVHRDPCPTGEASKGGGEESSGGASSILDSSSSNESRESLDDVMSWLVAQHGNVLQLKSSGKRPLVESERGEMTMTMNETSRSCESRRSNLSSVVHGGGFVAFFCSL